MRRAWLGSALALAFVGLALADDIGLIQPGRVGASFLLRGIGARPAGLGGAYTAVGDEPSAVAWNPGELGRAPGTGLAMMYESLGEGMWMSSLSASSAWPGGFVTGVGLTMVEYGSISSRDETGVVTGTESPVDVAATASGAMPLSIWAGHEVWVGIQAEGIGLAMGGLGVAGATGVLASLAPGVHAGAALMHVGPALSGSRLPSQARLGLGYSVSPQLLIAGDAAYGLGDRQTLGAAGGEIRPVPWASVRVGGSWASEAGSSHGRLSVAGGGGFLVGRLRFDYAYRPFANLPASHVFSLTLGGGAPRP